jgi:hypothetical protein
VPRVVWKSIWDGERSANGTPVPVVARPRHDDRYFVDIIKTIKVFLNFHIRYLSHYLSFENHCSITYQEVMARATTRILGDLLYVPTGHLCSTDGAVAGSGCVVWSSVKVGVQWCRSRAYDTDDDSDEDGPTVTSFHGLSRDGP